MRILIAEDDPVTRQLLQATLERWGYPVTAVADGGEALALLRSPEAPQLAILDWMMPGHDGPVLCRMLREHRDTASMYLILLTARGDTADLVAGLEAGANDYLTKPFDRDELAARVRVGVRVLELQQVLSDRVRELEEALAHIRRLQEILPICCYCKKVRDDRHYWQQVEAYLGEHGTRFSHGICPECWEARVVPELRDLGCDPRYPEG